MARPKKTGLSLQEAEQQEVSKNDFTSVIKHAEKNPYLYAGCVAFVVVCFLAGILVKAASASGDRKISSAYATAVMEEDPAKRLENLEALKDTGRWDAEVTYVIGETAIQVGKNDKAKEAFEKVCSKYASSPYAAQAADGLAFLLEDAGDTAGALKAYQDVEKNYPKTFIARIKPYDIARLQEKLGQLKEAVESYQRQVDSFADSVVANKAQQALDKLKAAHPELFPEEKKSEGEGEGETAAAPAPAGS